MPQFFLCFKMHFSRQSGSANVCYAENAVCGSGSFGTLPLKSHSFPWLALFLSDEMIDA